MVVDIYWENRCFYFGFLFFYLIKILIFNFYLIVKMFIGICGSKYMIILVFYLFIFIYIYYRYLCW